MKWSKSVTPKIKLSATIVVTAILAVALYLFFYPCELYVIDETLTLTVHSEYGSFSGVAVGPHLILTVAHGANLSGKMTVNHYEVFKVWSDEETDLALLRTEETFYQYSELSPECRIATVKGRELGPGDSGTAIVNKSGKVCFLLQGFDHTTGQYLYKPITKDAIEAVWIAFD